jgi:hypothetical protein
MTLIFSRIVYEAKMKPPIQQNVNIVELGKYHILIAKEGKKQPESGRDP